VTKVTRGAAQCSAQVWLECCCAAPLHAAWCCLSLSLQAPCPLTGHPKGCPGMCVWPTRALWVCRAYGRWWCWSSSPGCKVSLLDASFFFLFGVHTHARCEQVTCVCLVLWRLGKRLHKASLRCQGCVALPHYGSATGMTPCSVPVPAAVGDVGRVLRQLHVWIVTCLCYTVAHLTPLDGTLPIVTPPQPQPHDVAL